MTISVLALGHWGTAIANHLAGKGHKVLGWSADEDAVREINTSRSQAGVFPGVRLNPDLTATNDLNEALQSAVVVMAFPSSALKDLISKLKVRKDAIVVSALKGIESESLKTPLQYAEDFLDPSARLVVLSGPSFAVDLINSRPLGLVAASKHDDAARQTAELFSSSSLKVYLSSDPLGVEIGGIVKNVIAIATGVCDGLGMGDSARAGLITRGLAEMMRLAEAMGAESKTLAGLSGLGDLVMTASCDTSRNRTVGLRLGRGEKLQDIINSLGSVAEGVLSTPLILKLAERHTVDMPITLLVSKFLRGEVQLADLPKELLSRPTKKEFQS